MGTSERSRSLRCESAAGLGRGARAARLAACRSAAGEGEWGGKNEERDSARRQAPASFNHLALSHAPSLATTTRERPIHLPKQVHGSGS